MTPEEYETKMYMFGFTSAALMFNYWQRYMVPRWFYLFSASLGLFTGFVFGTIRTSWHFVEGIDALGKNYELGRMMKQDIFDTRPDLGRDTRASYYMYQEQQRKGDKDL
eukprot:CAMPEP_0176396768 /NCGR_PEP_ID=MMETSP0126-20121128/44539_1 /TAXON_ID=141414 ORGANISM="Strombidinopsis acuminatum, Strain SPMC142" /NCGR_SAMPLE_ID=MMETSP0126 /ASSEMBLY_ACC=CAM_ASM_000229 /LENGTH=108 /DNA_ID=CAMNT_0017770577 /DNA_START=306 /DNA_END=632 /DNA_ORIENTATION=-